MTLFIATFSNFCLAIFNPLEALPERGRQQLQRGLPGTTRCKVGWPTPRCACCIRCTSGCRIDGLANSRGSLGRWSQHVALRSRSWFLSVRSSRLGQLAGACIRPMCCSNCVSATAFHRWVPSDQAVGSSPRLWRDTGCPAQPARGHHTYDRRQSTRWPRGFSIDPCPAAGNGHAAHQPYHRALRQGDRAALASQLVALVFQNVVHDAGHIRSR